MFNNYFVEITPWTLLAILIVYFLRTMYIEQKRRYMKIQEDIKRIKEKKQRVIERYHSQDIIEEGK